MARPRRVSDQTIIAAAYELLIEQGPQKLTFENLSNQVDLVPAALVRRFKNKQHLLLLVDQYALELTNKKVQEAMSETASPIDAIITQFTTELAFASTIKRFVHGQEFLLMDFLNKDLYDNYKYSFEQRHQQIIEFLEKAQANGEIHGIEDISELARHIEMIVHGSGHVWAMTQEGPIELYIEHHVQVALKPYRKKGGAM